MNSIISKSITLIFCIFTLIQLVLCNANLTRNGINVCAKQIRFKDNYRQSYQVSYRHQYTTRCGFLGTNRCTRYRIKYRTNYRIATRTFYRKQYYCCKGWSQVGNQCTKAICTQPCVNGTCIRPDYCACSSGYYGKLCARDCPSHLWGPHCRHDCLCQNNAKCSPQTGTCTCTPGWEGRYCNKTCDQGYYGDNCQYKCSCFNGGTCDPVSGYNCTCAPGYQGQQCKFECSYGWFGKDCAQRCVCQNGSTCDHVIGTCQCLPGYTGERCEILCTDDNLGRKCQGNCACRNNATCSPLGFCSCTPGYTGMLCERNCSIVVPKCLRKCNCSRWGHCNPYSGKCICQPGYIGQACGTQCPDDKYGPGCTANCTCQNNATCSKKDGSCDCLPGWTGVECKNPCPAGYYGKNCQSKCLCQNGASCDPVTGQCTCVGEWQGEFCRSSTLISPRPPFPLGTMTFDRDKQSREIDGVLLASVPSSAGFIVIIIILVVVLTECRRRKKRRRKLVTKDPSLSENEKAKVASVVKNDQKRTRKRRGKENRNVDIQLQAPFFDNIPTQNSKESHLVNVGPAVTIETQFTDLLNTGSIGNEIVYQPLNKNILESQLAGINFYGNHEYRLSNPKGFQGDYQSLGLQEKDNHVYQGLSFKPSSSGEIDSSPLYDSVSIYETPVEPQYQNSPLEEDETYITMIS